MIQDLITLLAIFTAVGFMLRSSYLKSKVMRRDVVVSRQAEMIEQMRQKLNCNVVVEESWPEILEVK